MYNDICKNSRTGFLSCRLSSSANSLEDDRFGREVGEVERGAAQGGRSKISTLWNSMGWFMTAISHQWRHALPRAPFGQHELARTDVQVSLRSHISRSIRRISHLRWIRGKPLAREKFPLFNSLFLFSTVSFPPYHRYNPSYIFLLRCFMRLISG